MHGSTGHKLEYEFFNRDTVEVAKYLIGQYLIFNNYLGMITETEAYRNSDDPASHAYRGPTPRSKIMFNRPGVSYVYLIYGMYYCLNFVTDKADTAGAVLIRGLNIIQPMNHHINGPGKICKYLGINKNYNNIDITNNANFYLLSNNLDTIKYNAMPRVGIKVATDKLWRFVLDSCTIL